MGFFKGLAHIGSEWVHGLTDPVGYLSGGGLIGSVVRELTPDSPQPPANKRYYERKIDIITDPDEDMDRHRFPNIDKGLNDILNHYRQKRLKMVQLPPLYGVAYPDREGGFNANVTLQVVDPMQHMNGMLSRIVVHYLETQGVVGLQQYFGHVPGELLGTRGDFKVKEFHIPLSDRLQHVSALYIGMGGDLRAIRFRTKAGRDSGWIGQLNIDGIVFEYECREENADGDLEYYPILALDAFTAGERRGITVLAARFTYPYRVTTQTENEEREPADSPLWLRDWVYENHSETPQSVTLSDAATVSTSHTVTDTTSDSKTTSHSLSMGATVMIEALTISRNETTSSSVTHTTTKTKSVTAEQTTTKYFEFPLSVPPLTKISAQVEIREMVYTEAINGQIEWLAPGQMGIPPVEFSLEYSGAQDLNVSVVVQSEPISAT